MRFALARGHSTIKYLFDRFLYQLICLMSYRSLKAATAVGPLGASTSDLITHRLISTGFFENLHLAALDAVLDNPSLVQGLTLKRDGLFVDVGANIGIFSIRYAKFFRKVLSIEPNPITFNLLTANIIMRRCSNITAVRKGASNSKRKALLNIDTKGVLGWAHLDKSHFNEKQETFPLPVALDTLDNIVRNSIPGINVSLIKIDIEGHEASCLEGAFKILGTDRPAVLYEKNDASKQDNCAKILKSHGYNRFLVFKREASLLTPWSYSTVIATDVEPDNSGPAALVLSFFDDRVLT